MFPSSSSGASQATAIARLPKSALSMRTSMDDKFMEQTWDYLKKAIDQIQRKCHSELSYEELYRRAYNMVLHKYGHKIYSGLLQVLEEHMRNVRRPVEEAESGNVLPVILQVWKDHTVAMNMIRDILLYVDRVYVKQNNIKPVYDQGLSAFQTHVVCYNDVNERIRREILDMIRLERDGGLIDWLLLKQICGMLDDINVYDDVFEKPFLAETAEYYRKLGSDLISNNTSTVYVDQVEKFIQEEAIRAQRCFKAETKQKLLEAIDNELIKVHVETIVGKERSGVVFLLEDHSRQVYNSPGEGRIRDLHKIFTLLNRINGGHAILCKSVADWIRRKGEQISDPALQSEEIKSSPILYINSLIELKKQADDLITKAFDGSSIFKNRIYAEFEYFTNRNENAAEYLDQYIDEKLKKGVRVLTDTEIEQSISGVMELFRFLANKDAFEHYYKRFLARRLLNERSVSDDVEKRMINRLRIECGYQYTQKLELMFKDRELWPTLQGNYREHLENLGMRMKMLDMQVRVLTCGVWPSTTAMQCSLPEQAERAYLTFNEFYTKRHNGRRLALNTCMGSADIKATFYNPTNNELSQSSTTELPSYASASRTEVQKILSVTTHQMAVLMLFNGKSVYTYVELLEATKIPEAELARVIQSLSMGKVSQRVLVRKTLAASNPDTIGKIDNSDVFFVNDLFTSKLARVKIHMITESRKNQSGNEIPNEDRERVREQTEEDRKHEVECAIVRLMKSRKRLDHNNLIAQVIEQVVSRFHPTPSLIKQRIEALIERDYLLRDKKDERVYNYVS